MSVSIAILKVLASYPEGRTSHASLKSDLAMLATPEWSARMRALGVRAGSVNLFSDGLATRDAAGWTITQAGRDFIERLESNEQPATKAPAQRPLRRVSLPSAVATPRAAKPRIRIVKSA